MEAWGRKKRSIGGGPANALAGSSKGGSGKPLGDDMTLSREIVVLDLKEKEPNSTNPPSAGDADLADNDLQSGASGKAQKSPLKATSDPTFSSAHLDAHHQSLNSMHCLSSQSLFVLICSIGLFFVLYVCVVAYFFARRDPKISTIKHQFH